MSLGTKHVIELRSVSCTRTETGISSSVRDVSLELAAGTVTLLTGEAGSGKNLILRLLGLLEVPDSGEVVFQGESVSRMPKDCLADLRTTACGYVFSPPFLLPGFTVMENIAMPLFKVFEMRPIDAQERTEKLMNFMDLAAFTTKKIDKLSLEFQHRVGLARALGSLPPLVIVEQPDRILHRADLESFRKILHRTAAEFGCAVAISAGAEIPSMHGERRVECAAGRIVCDVMP